MKRLLSVFAIIAASMFGTTGCDRPSPIQGDWSSTDEFGDSSGMATATMALVHRGDIVSGNFIFTSLSDEAREELGKTTFPLEQVRLNGGHLTFVVPILSDDPREALLFTLQLDGETLSGTMKENDSKDDRSIPIEFRKN